MWQHTSIIPGLGSYRVAVIWGQPNLHSELPTRMTQGAFIWKPTNQTKSNRTNLVSSFLFLQHWIWHSQGWFFWLLKGTSHARRAEPFKRWATDQPKASSLLQKILTRLHGAEHPEFPVSYGDLMVLFGWALTVGKLKDADKQLRKLCPQMQIAPEIFQIFLDFTRILGNRKRL